VQRIALFASFDLRTQIQPLATTHDFEYPDTVAIAPRP
jgi:hypothetical protein